MIDIILGVLIICLIYGLGHHMSKINKEKE